MFLGTYQFHLWGEIWLKQLLLKRLYPYTTLCVVTFQQTVICAVNVVPIGDFSAAQLGRKNFSNELLDTTENC